MDRNEVLLEVAKCYRSPAHFIRRHCQIYDATRGVWIPFEMWAAQEGVLRDLELRPLVVILKARQLGMTWLALAFALWLMIFRPAVTVLIFSRRENEAIYLLSDERLRGMVTRLPDFLRPRITGTDSASVLQLANGSVCRAFPTSAGDSYTASLAIVDEADLVPDLGRLMRAVKPTIDGGGRMLLLSRADKDAPRSEFKAIYRAAKAGGSGWHPVFLSWSVRPERTADWYEAQRQDILTRTGSLDDLHEQYPATDAEALAPRALGKRIPPAWILRSYDAMQGLDVLRAPALPGLLVYRPPQPGRRYVIGADPAEGNPTSDDSAATVLDRKSGEEVASLRGKFEPGTFAAHIDKLGTWYNRASIMPERNNHGHAVILWLREHSQLTILCGHDGKLGWLSNTKGKALLYDAAAEAFQAGTAVLHTFETMTQLSSIEGRTLRAPEGEHDDMADSYALAVVGDTAPAAEPGVPRSAQLRPKAS